MKFLVSSRGLRRIVTVAALALAAYGVFLFVQDRQETTLTAYFTSAEGLYEGDDVRVLGVRVGTIESIEPVDEGVEVVLVVEDGQDIPAGAEAAIVSPSLVSGRFVQLSPAYTGGERMADGAVISLNQTAVPVTFDDVKQQLTDLSTALGPRDGQQRGALARAITSIDASLQDGNSAALRQSIAELRSAAAALSDPRSDLFATVANLDTFTRNLAVNDGAVRGFTVELDGAGRLLTQNRKIITAVIRDLARTLDQTRGFLQSNGSRISTSAKKLNLLAAAIADRSNELAGALHIGPNALINLGNIVEDDALTGRATLSNLDNVAQLVCGAVLGAGGTAEQCRTSLQPLLDLLGLGDVDLGSIPLPGLPLAPPDPDRPGQPTLPDVADDLVGTVGDLLTGTLGGRR